MAKDGKLARRPYGKDKQSQHFRLLPDMIRRLEDAAAKRGVSKTVYVQLSLEAQFKRDKID
jgi:hypothetical protein